MTRMMKFLGFWLILNSLMKSTTSTLYDYSSQSLTSLPNIPLDAQQILFKYNKLTSISDQDFKNFVDVWRIDLLQNLIASISQNAFDYNTKLTMLELSNNPIGIFPYFPALQTRSLTFGLMGCHITDTTWDRVVGYTNLNALYLNNNNFLQFPFFNSACKILLTNIMLSNCGIGEIPADYFQGFVKLTHLFLDSNQISSLSVSAFAGLTKLQKLSITNNQITMIENLAAQIPTLQILDARSNLLNSFPDLSGLSLLTTLKLDDNAISGVVSASLFIGVNKLATITVSNNAISKFEESSLQHMPSLETLDLEANMYIQCIRSMQTIQPIKFT